MPLPVRSLHRRRAPPVRVRQPGEEAVTSGVDLNAAIPVQNAADLIVMPGEQRHPSRVTDLLQAIRRAHHVGEQDRLHHARHITTPCDSAPTILARSNYRSAQIVRSEKARAVPEVPFRAQQLPRAWSTPQAARRLGHASPESAVGAPRLGVTACLRSDITSTRNAAVNVRAGRGLRPHSTRAITLRVRLCGRAFRCPRGHADSVALRGKHGRSGVIHSDDLCPGRNTVPAVDPLLGSDSPALSAPPKVPRERRCGSERTGTRAGETLYRRGWSGADPSSRRHGRAPGQRGWPTRRSTYPPSPLRRKLPGSTLTWPARSGTRCSVTDDARAGASPRSSHRLSRA